MRHHVQEKRKQRKVSHENLQLDQIQDPSLWQAKKDSGYDTDTHMETPLSGPQAPPPEADSSVWKAINAYPVQYCEHDQVKSDANPVSNNHSCGLGSLM